MQDAGADNEHISFPQFKFLKIADSPVRTFGRHDHFIRRMPVGRIVFRLIIIVEPHTEIGAVIDDLVCSAKVFDHDDTLSATAFFRRWSSFYNSSFYAPAFCYTG